MQVLLQALENLRLFRTRPDDIHVAGQNIEQLRQFIEAKFPENSFPFWHYLSVMGLLGPDAAKLAPGPKGGAALVPDT